MSCPLRFYGFFADISARCLEELLVADVRFALVTAAGLDCALQIVTFTAAVVELVDTAGGASILKCLLTTWEIEQLGGIQT